MDMTTMYPVGATVKVVKDIEQGRDSLGIYIIPKGERGIVIHSGPCEWGDPVVIVVFEHLSPLTQFDGVQVTAFDGQRCSDDGLGSGGSSVLELGGRQRRGA
jgi:hypothetical protein